MNYQVHITKTAEHDIAKAADYIEFGSFLPARWSPAYRNGRDLPTETPVFSDTEVLI